MTALSKRIPMVLLMLTMGFTSSAALAGDDYDDDHDDDYDGHYDGHRYKGRTIVDRLVAIDGAQALVAAVLYADMEANAGIAKLLSNKRSRFTVLAPSNEAFEALLGVPLKGLSIEDIKAELYVLVPDAEAVKGILLKHVASGKADANKLLRKRCVTVLSKEPTTLLVGIGASGVTVNHEINVIKADVTASNGIIHFIDTVIQAGADCKK